MLSLSGVVGTDASPEGQRRFARSSNTLHLIASAPVIRALHEYRDEIRVSNPNRSDKRHDELLTKLLEAIRRDLGIPSRAGDPSFQARLWVSGANEPDQPSRSLARLLEHAPNVGPEFQDRI